MPFVTTLQFRSGDRKALDAVVEQIKRLAERKGIEVKGPHTSPPASYRVPLYRGIAGTDGEYPPWDYTVYERILRVSGHDETVRDLVARDVPASVRVEVDVTQVRQTGSRSPF